MLDGKKTYVAGFALIAFAILGALLRKIENEVALQLLLEGFGLIGLRHAIEKK